MNWPTWNQIPEILFISLFTICGFIMVKHMIKFLVLTLLIIRKGHRLHQSIRDWENTDKSKKSVTIYSYFNIRYAVMCINCETVFSRKEYKQCPSCTGDSAYIIGLAFKTKGVCPHIKMKGVTT